MMSRGNEGRQTKAGLGNAMKPNKSKAENGDAVYEPVSEDQTEMNQGPAEKVRTGREQKAKPAAKYSGAVMSGGNQESTRGAIMRNR